MVRLLFVLAVFSVTAAQAENREPIEDRAFRVIGYGAKQVIEKIHEHNLIPEDIKVLGPYDEGDVTMHFVILDGWDTLANIPSAVERCADTCVADEGKDLHMATTTLVNGDDINKLVFIDATGIAPLGTVLASQGYVGCLAEQMAVEASWIWADTTKCLSKIFGGMTVKRRKDTVK